MKNVELLLKAYIEAVSEPTRASILMEIEKAGELTATQLAERLDLTPNNVYHHLRVIKRFGVLDEPRVVPGSTYVEKYYRLRAELSEAFKDPGWLDRAQQDLSVEARQAFWCAFAMVAGQLMIRAAKQYQAMDPATWQETVLQQPTGMISLRELGPSQYQENLATLRAQVVNRPTEDGEPHQYVLLIAALPGIWDSPRTP